MYAEDPLRVSSNMRFRFGVILPVLTVVAATTATPARAQQLVVPQAASLPRLDSNNKDVGRGAIQGSRGRPGTSR